MKDTLEGMKEGLGGTCGGAADLSSVLEAMNAVAAREREVDEVASRLKGSFGTDAFFRLLAEALSDLRHSVERLEEAGGGCHG